MTQPEAHETGPEEQDPLAAAVELLHRTNNFLTLCITQTEMALESEDPEELIEALRAIHGGAEEMADHSRGARVQLLDEERPESARRRSA